MHFAAGNRWLNSLNISAVGAKFGSTKHHPFPHSVGTLQRWVTVRKILHGNIAATNLC
jgi:hypothetical protein